MNASSSDEENDAENDSEYFPSDIEISKCSAESETSFKKSKLSISSNNNISLLNQTGLDPCNEDEMFVDKSRGRKGDKKSNFCVFCHTKQQKIARHLELKHKDEEDVKKFTVLPKMNAERRNIIAVLRKKGNYLFNLNKNLNDGELIVSRRPNAKFARSAGYYKACGNCKGYFSKNSLRAHYAQCTKKEKSSNRIVMVMSKRVMGRIHPIANSVVRKYVFSNLREDHVVKAIRYDELAIIYANKMVEKYKNARYFEMIRSRLRLIGRLLLSLRKLQTNITDFASIFDPKNLDNVVKAINIEAKLKENFTYETPSVAFSLGTLIKQLGHFFISECIKKHENDKKNDAENFLKLFNEEINIGINRTVAESQFQMQRRKTVKLPPLDDIKKLHRYLLNERRKAFYELSQKFSATSWKTLCETTLTSVQLFNRRRAGEIERVLIDDFRAYHGIDQNTNSDLFNSLSSESKEIAKQYIRFEIRGKLNRNVPVLLNQELLKCIELILKYRKKAGVLDDNPYLFGIPSNRKTTMKYLRACVLMRNFSESCGAANPERLRGTELRKHIATTCLTLNLSEQEVDHVSDFMGHRKDIHKTFYRQPIVSREILRMSKLLEAAQGAPDDLDSSDEESLDTNLDPRSSTKYKSSKFQLSILIEFFSSSEFCGILR